MPYRFNQPDEAMPLVLPQAYRSGRVLRISTKFPERSAIVPRSSPTDDGLLQAREVLDLRLRAELVTLSACETGRPNRWTGGCPESCATLPGRSARTVVANLWAADDTFSPVLMKEFFACLQAARTRQTRLGGRN